MKCYVERTDPARGQKGEVIRIVVEINTNDPHYKNELADIYARFNINENRLGAHSGQAADFYNSSVTAECIKKLSPMMIDLGREERIRP